jgi:hypothetical protein
MQVGQPKHQHPHGRVGLKRCCGTVMIGCGFGSNFTKVLVPVPDPDNI